MPQRTPRPALPKPLTLEEENALLRKIAHDFHWMARRYADGRRTFAASTVNSAVRALLEIGVELNPTGDGTIWARDGDGRNCDGLTDDEAAMGRGPDFWDHRHVLAEDYELLAGEHAALLAYVRHLHAPPADVAVAELVDQHVRLWEAVEPLIEGASDVEARVIARGEYERVRREREILLAFAVAWELWRKLRDATFAVPVERYGHATVEDQALLDQASALIATLRQKAEPIITAEMRRREQEEEIASDLDRQFLVAQAAFNPVHRAGEQKGYRDGA